MEEGAGGEEEAEADSAASAEGPDSLPSGCTAASPDCCAFSCAFLSFRLSAAESRALCPAGGLAAGGYKV
jgi:hypothetical protein